MEIAVFHYTGNGLSCLNKLGSFLHGFESPQRDLHFSYLLQTFVFVRIHIEIIFKIMRMMIIIIIIIIIIITFQINNNTNNR